MAAVTKDTFIGDILDMDESTAPFFFEYGNALPWVPVGTGGNIRRSLYGSRCRRK